MRMRKEVDSGSLYKHSSASVLPSNIRETESVAADSLDKQATRFL